MMDREVYTRLELIAGKNSLSDSDEDRLCHSYDATRQSYLPDVVMWPSDTHEVSGILNVAHENRIPVYPRGSGTGLTGGALPLRGGIALDLSRMSRILAINKKDLTALVEPGVVVQTLQKAVEQQGLFYPPDPASSDTSTIGGNVAECAGGMRGLKYGVTRDYVLWLEAVLASGKIIHTGAKTLKSVTGYDLTRLFVGSEGTLGIFTKILVRLVPLPEAVAALCFSYGDVKDAIETVSSILESGILPRTVEFLDHTTLQALRNYKKDYRFSEKTGALLMVELDGERTVVERDAQRVMEIGNDTGALQRQLARTDPERSDIEDLRKSVSPALYSLCRLKINEDICVPLSALSRVIGEIGKIEKKHSLTIANFGHAGDGNIHVNLLIKNPDDTAEMESAERATEEIFKAALELGGTLSGEHGIGITKSRYLGLELPAEEQRLMKSIKNLFDPHGIMNPGKIFPDS